MMQYMSIYVFGYGSLLNPKSRAKTFSEAHVITNVVLHGYQRILNAGISAYPDIAMNIVENKESEVTGILIELTTEELEKLKQREVGYELVDVSKNILHKTNERVFTFIMSECDCKNKKIFQTYIDTCLGGVEKDKREKWIKETIIEYPIFDDRNNPQYINYVPLTEK